MFRNLLIVSLLFVLLAGCSDTGGTRKKLRVIATTGIVADLVSRIGGDAVEVTTLMGPGVDPHLFKASEGNVISMARADVIFYGGLHLEGKLTDVLEKIADRLPTVAVTDGIPKEQLILVDNGQYDPHVWFDVKLWSLCSRPITETLSKLDPVNKDYYLMNEEDALREFSELEAEVSAAIAQLPREKRILVTAHDAFGYFGRAYGFNVVGVQGVSTASEAAASDIVRLADFIVRWNVPAIFVEKSVSPRTIKALRAAVKSRGKSVTIGGELYSDALGGKDSTAATYPGMVRTNIATIVKALR